MCDLTIVDVLLIHFTIIINFEHGNQNVCVVVYNMIWFPPVCRIQFVVYVIYLFFIFNKS